MSALNVEDTKIVHKLLADCGWAHMYAGACHASGLAHRLSRRLHGEVRLEGRICAVHLLGVERRHAAVALAGLQAAAATSMHCTCQHVANCRSLCSRA